MKYKLYKQGPEERQGYASNVPTLKAPWVLVGTVDRDAEPADVSWAGAVKELTGKSIEAESVRGTWYKLIAEEVE